MTELPFKMSNHEITPYFFLFYFFHSTELYPNVSKYPELKNKMFIKAIGAKWSVWTLAEDQTLSYAAFEFSTSMGKPFPSSCKQMVQDRISLVHIVVVEFHNFLVFIIWIKVKDAQIFVCCLSTWLYIYIYIHIISLCVCVLISFMFFLVLIYFLGRIFYFL